MPNNTCISEIYCLHFRNTQTVLKSSYFISTQKPEVALRNVSGKLPYPESHESEVKKKTKRHLTICISAVKY